MVYLILIIFFRSHLFLFRKSAFLPLKTSKMSEKWLFCSDTVVSGGKFCRWKWRFAFTSFNEKYRFCSVCCTRFWLKSVSFSFSYLQNEKHINFWNVFQVYKQKTTFFLSISKFTTWKKKHVFEALFKFTT